MKRIRQRARATRQAGGFSLIELTVMMAVFLIISIAALNLVRRDATAFSSQQAQSALNVGLRNAIAQMHIDMMNAGTGFYQNIYVPGSPIGVTIANQSSTSCYNSSTKIYSASCFDTLNILAFAGTSPTVPTATYNTACGTANCTMVLTPATNSTMTAAQIAAAYTSGTELLLVTSAVSSTTGQPQFMTVILNSNATASGNNITIQFPQTTKTAGACADGTGTNCYSNSGDGASGSNLLIAKVGTGAMTSTFGVNDYALKLSAITYSVDTTTDANNPRLVRKQNNVSSVLMDRVIGFKVGAMTWGGSRSVAAAAGDDVANYRYDPSTYPYANDFTLVRSIRVSLVARTNPDPTSLYKNGFDGGNYRVESVSTVISPRNLSMLDQ